MPFVFLLLFALVCLQSTWPHPFEWPTEEGCAILVGGLIAISWLSAWVIARVLVWQLQQHPELRNTILRRYGRFRRWHFIGLLSAFVALLYALSWGHFLLAWWQAYVPAYLQSRENFPGFHIGLLLPFFVALVAAWERFYGVEKAAYELGHPNDRFLSKLGYLLMQVRHQFFLVLPPMFLMLSLQVIYLFFNEDQAKGDWPALIMVGIMVVALILMPVFLRIFLGLQPLPAGPLRTRLEATAERLGFRFSNVLVWNTRHLMANALVTGFVPWIRYVVLTDRLIDELTPEEIEAVFGHEVGHIKHHHLFFYLAFFLTSFILLSFYWEQLKGLFRDDIKSWIIAAPVGEDLWSALKTVGKLSILALYTLLCFGFISRRCERQADLFGSSTVSTDVFISALEKVAHINGIPRDRVGNWFLSWQHPTIAQRVDFLEAMRDNPARVPGFHRSIAMLKWAFFLALVSLVCLFGVSGVWELLKEF